MKHVFREHNQEADHWANIGAQRQRKIVFDRRNNSGTWKAVKGDWDGRFKDNGKSRCGVVIKGIDRDKWVTISKIAIPLIVGVGTAGCVFMVYKILFFWDTKDQSDFFGHKKSFSGYKKIVLDIFRGQRGLINCKIVLDILEGQKRQGWGSTVGDPKSSRKSSRKQQHKQQKKQHKESEAAHKTEKKQKEQQKQQKAQTSKAAQAEVSCTNSSTKSTNQQQKQPNTLISPAWPSASRKVTLCSLAPCARRRSALT